MSLENYQEISKIYEEADVCITRARCISSNFRVVLKKQLCASYSQVNKSIAAAMNQARLNHHAICKVYECFFQPANSEGFLTVTVEEEMEGDLNTEIQRRKAVSEYWTEYELMTHLADLSAACAYAQENGIVHRNLKPQNVLMSQGKLKLGDFRSSALDFTDSMHRTLRGTQLFLSPELKQKFAQFASSGVLDSSMHDAYQSDVFSLGVMMVFMAYLSPPSWFASITDLQRNIETMLREFANMPTMQYILAQMLQIDPNQRPTFAKVSEYCNNYFQPKCQLCGNGIKSNWSSTTKIEDELKCFSSMLTEVCSKECLRDLCARKYKPDCCMSDLKHLEGSGVILMRCGHGFCNLGCLIHFLKNPNICKVPQVWFACKVCQYRVEESEVSSFFQSETQMKRYVNGNLSADCCDKCYIKPHEKVLKCSHKLCLGCLKLSKGKKDKIIAICPVCGVSNPYEK